VAFHATGFRHRQPPGPSSALAYESCGRRPPLRGRLELAHFGCQGAARGDRTRRLTSCLFFAGPWERSTSTACLVLVALDLAESGPGTCFAALRAWHRGTTPTHGDRAKGAGSKGGPLHLDGVARSRGASPFSRGRRPDGRRHRAGADEYREHARSRRRHSAAGSCRDRSSQREGPFESSLCWFAGTAPRIAVSTVLCHDPRRLRQTQRCDPLSGCQRQNVVLAALDSRSRQTDRRVHPATVASAPTRWPRRRRIGCRRRCR